MNRKDFVLVAKGLRASRPEPGSPAWLIWSEVHDELMLSLERAHAHFDRARFEKATGRKP